MKKVKKRKKTRQKRVKNKGWQDILGKLTYSSGPGDNIYVYG